MTSDTGCAGGKREDGLHTCSGRESHGRPIRERPLWVHSMPRSPPRRSHGLWQTETSWTILRQRHPISEEDQV